MAFLNTDDGARLHYRVQGKDTDAVPLILIHGWCSNLEHWAPQARYFGRSRRVLRLDRRGMGRSTSPGSGHTAEQHAADVAAVARAAGFARAVVAGHAGGGPATLEVLRSYPRLARAGVMVDAGMYPQPRLGDPDSAFGAALGGMIESLSGKGARRTLRKMYRGYFNAKCDRAVARTAIDQAMETELAVAVDELRGIAVSTQGIADQVRQPVLWLTATGVDQTYIAKHLAKVSFGEVVGSGHFPQLEVPAQTNAMIDTFIQQL